MYYTVYKTTNQINGKFYIGTHKTVNLNDDYIGSGTLLKRAIEKYGIENFKKEILFVFSTAAEMFNKEAEIVTKDFLVEENTYNLKIGGFGGWDYINQQPLLRIQKNQLARINASKAIEKKYGVTNPGQLDKSRKISSEKMKNLHEERRVKYNNFAGKKHTNETKQKISAANKNMSGSKNSQYGTIWITDGMINKKIKNNDILPVGWTKGRKI